ncbi:MAG: hypothetical protein FD163_2510 [Hyphomonadaceae bacterium]|nr:MAG: hypothetical protein FD128_1594 [Hyphomonadaceae bacterium]KAF0182720.1 MAG: hypothetical protein FD163_2510 [Hyphomonadaceae bacterium]
MNEYQEVLGLVHPSRPEMHKFRSGDVVCCIVPRSRVSEDWDLREREIFTVLDYHEGGITLSSIQKMVVNNCLRLGYFDASRFKLISRPAAQRQTSEQMIIRRERIAA